MKICCAIGLSAELRFDCALRVQIFWTCKCSAFCASRKRPLCRFPSDQCKRGFLKLTTFQGGWLIKKLDIKATNTKIEKISRTTIFKLYNYGHSKVIQFSLFEWIPLFGVYSNYSTNLTFGIFSLQPVTQHFDIPYSMTSWFLKISLSLFVWLTGTNIFDSESTWWWWVWAYYWKGLYC